MRPGDLLAERFQIEREAGSGGMGVVFQAIDLLTGRRVAVKVLRSEEASSERRLAREARALSELSHPAIVEYVAHGSAASGELFLAMEWLQGEDLEARLARGRLEVEETVRLVGQVAAALGAAHAAGVIHRDVKPSNVFLVERSLAHVKVLDFGIARLFGPQHASMTRTGSVVGTPAFMAPEQARGEEVTARADVFALGLLLFECLTGQSAFSGQHVMAVLAKILLEQAPRIRSLRPDVPLELDALCARMLAKDPLERPESGAEVAAALAAWTEVSGMGATLQLGVDWAGNLPSAREATTPSRALTASERLLVSVLVARQVEGDPVEGFAPTWDADRAQVRRRCFEAVAPFGARLEWLVHGNLVATLPGGGAATDQAVQAARCALALRQAAPHAVFALATGRAEVQRSLPVGPAIEEAARLGAMPPPAEEGSRPLRIDQVTAGLLDERFDVGGDPHSLFLRGERDAQDTPRTLLGKPTPLVGRERDLASLLGYFDECVAEGMARAVLVIAPAGAGKSRLRREVASALQARHENMEVWVGRGDPVGAGSPFGLIAPLLRRLAVVHDSEALDVRQKKLRARVSRHVAAADVERVANFLGEMIGTPFSEGGSLPLRAARSDPILMGDQMRRAWEDFVAAESEAHPLLLVFEDLQWGDLPSIGLVDSALRVVKSKPWMVLALARPEVRSRFPDLWAGRTVAHLELGELGRRSAEKLIAAVLGDVPADTVQRIVEKAAGNAFYLEEIIRAVAEGRGDSIPPTIVAMAQARIEAFDPQARRILRAASVFGTVFWKAGVAALLGAETGASLREKLDLLVAREAVVRLGSSRFQGDDELVFRHAVMREAAYGMLTDTDRALGHRLAGAFLEASGEKEAVVLAEHFERAGDLEKAVVAYHRAADQALEGNDWDSAVLRATRAETLGASGDRLGVLALLRASALLWRGASGQGSSEAVRAMQASPRGGRVYYEAAMTALIHYQRLGQRERFNEILAETRESPWTEAERAARLEALATGARNALFFDAVPLARSVIEECVELERPLNGAHPASAALFRALGILAVCTGDPEQYMRFEERAARTLEAAGDFRRVSSARLGAADAKKELGCYEEAESDLLAVLTVADRMALGPVSMAGQTHLGLVLAMMGRAAEAAPLLACVASEYAKEAVPRQEAFARIYLTRALLLVGDNEGAEREAKAAMEVSRDLPPMRSYASAALCQVYLAMGKVEEAARAAVESRALLESVEAIDEGEIYIFVALAESALALGDSEEASRIVDRARARLAARASRLQDEHHRVSYLTRVPENRRIAELS